MVCRRMIEWQSFIIWGDTYIYLYVACLSLVKICQEGTEGIGYSVAEDGSEQVWVDTDGTIYLYYTGPDNRLAMKFSTFYNTPCLAIPSYLVY